MEYSRAIKSCIGLFLLLIQVSLSCHAQSLQAPAGRIILTIDTLDDSSSTAGQTTEPQKTISFDLAMLEASGLIQLTTETPWTDGLVEFEGVLVREILEKFGIEGQSVRATALGNYIVEIPMEDFIDHDVIFATRLNGEPIGVRENGPIWIIYPWTEEPDLRRPRYYARSIWQLKSLTVLP